MEQNDVTVILRIYFENQTNIFLQSSFKCYVSHGGSIYSLMQVYDNKSVRLGVTPIPMHVHSHSFPLPSRSLIPIPLGKIIYSTSKLAER